MITKRAGILCGRASLTLLVFGNIAWSGIEYPQRARETVVVSPRTVELIRSYLTSPDPIERTQALDALRQLRDPSLAPAAKALLNDPDPNVRSQTLLALEAMLPPKELVPILESKCADAAQPVVRQALAVLGGVPGPEAFAALNHAGSTLAREFLEDWALALARRDEQVDPTVIERFLDSSNRSVRVAAMQIALRNPAIMALPRRVALLSDPNPWIRARAIAALANDKNDPQVRTAVIDRLADPSSIVRRAALEWVETAGVELPIVEPYLEDGDATVRAAAVRVAGRLGTTAAVTKLVRRLADRELLVARLATEQLATIPLETVPAALIDCLTDESNQVVSQAARCLGLRKSRTALNELQSLGSHASQTVRSDAYEAIGRIGDPEVVPWLLEAANKERGWPRASINQALGRLKDNRAIDHLMADCHYPDKKSKGLNPALFTPMGGPPPYSTPDTAVATEAVRALGELGDIAAVPVVIEVSRDILRNEAFWTAVAESLGRFADTRVRESLVALGVVGTIVQGMAGAEIPIPARIAALRSMAKLELTDTVELILQLDPPRSTIPLRQAAAEVLTQLTGTEYTYRLPMRLGSFFIEDRATAVDLSPFKLPVCHRVDAP